MASTLYNKKMSKIPSYPTNLQIAELLRDVAASHKLKNQNKYKFQIIAYERAADAVEHSTSELKDLWDDGKLEEIPGIGKSIAGHLDELFKNGKSGHFDEIMQGIPKKAFKLMELPGIGIKTAVKLIEKESPNKINKLLKKVEEKEKKGKRHLLPYAALIATEILEYLLKNTLVARVDPLGSLRRQVATIGDIDLAVATKQPERVLKYFTEYPKAVKTIEIGEHTASILLPGEVRVDLMVQPPGSYGSLLQHFTGSKHHNIALREYALKKGFSLSEYGIKKIKPINEKRKVFKSETEFYKYLGLDYIQPELREDAGEIEAAINHSLPNLVKLDQIRADLQIHSNFNIETSHDLGESSVEEIVKKGNELGYEYLALTEHNPSQKGHSVNQIIDILKRKKEVVEQLNYSLKKKNTNSVQKVFNSLEIDMKPDGTLPVPPAGLSTLDFALVSIHSSFDLERSVQTKRVLLALSHPKVLIFAHPTGRKLNEREGAELNWPEIFDFCLTYNKLVEINCDPMRLDLPDALVREAVKKGVKLTLGTDAHHVDGMNNMVFGVSVARRGWASSVDIVNCRSLKEFEKMIR